MYNLHLRKRVEFPYALQEQVENKLDKLEKKMGS